MGTRDDDEERQSVYKGEWLRTRSSSVRDGRRGRTRGLTTVKSEAREYEDGGMKEDLVGVLACIRISPVSEGWERMEDGGEYEPFFPLPPFWLLPFLPSLPLVPVSLASAFSPVCVNRETTVVALRGAPDEGVSSPPRRARFSIRSMYPSMSLVP